MSLITSLVDFNDLNLISQHCYCNPHCLNQNDKLHPHSRVEDVALKLVNILNAKTGSVWLIRPEQLQPFNVPDYRLPVKVGYTAANTYLPCYGQHR